MSVGSVGLLLYASRLHTPPLLLAIFVVWMLSPYAAWAVGSRRWPVLNRVMLVVAPVSLVLYAAADVRSPKPAFMFLLVPAGLLVAMAIASALTASDRS